MLMMYVMTLFALVGAMTAQARQYGAAAQARELEFVYVAVRSIAPPRAVLARVVDELAGAKWVQA